MTSLLIKISIPMAGTRYAEAYDAVTMLLHLSKLMGCCEGNYYRERFRIQIFKSKDIKVAFLYPNNEK